MKKIFILVAVCTLLASCTSNKFSLSGQLNGEVFNGRNLYLVNRFGDMDTVATAVVENGKFTIKGVTKETMMCTLTCNTEDPRMSFRAAIIIEPGNEYTMGKDIPLFQGGKLQQIIANFAKENYNSNRANYRVQSQIRNDNTLSKEVISQKIDSLNKSAINKLYSKIDSIIKECDNTYITAYLLSNISRIGKDKEFKEIYESSSDLIKNDKILKDTYNDIINREKSSAGQIFIDFSVENGNLDGTPVKLSDYVGKGKYILVDFWASWCSPCKGEIPYIKKVYDKYHGNNFDIVSVAVNDKREDTIKAAKEHGVVWNQIVDAQDVPCKLYSIVGIPTLILFAPDGTIIDRNLRGLNGTLQAKLKEIFGR